MAEPVVPANAPLSRYERFAVPDAAGQRSYRVDVRPSLNGQGPCYVVSQWFEHRQPGGMMIVVMVGQAKGGVGKTTLAVNVAGEMSRLNRSVTLIDADPQGSAAEWAAPRKLPFSVRHLLLTPDNALAWVRDILKSPGEVVIVDTPAGLGPIFETGALIADLIVVPCGPSSLDIGSAGKTIAKIKEVRRNDALPTRFKIVTVPTRIDSTTDEGQQIRDELSDFGEIVAPALSHDVEFVRSFAAGLPVSSIPAAIQASAEVGRLSAFLLKAALPRQSGAAAFGS